MAVQVELGSLRVAQFAGAREQERSKLLFLQRQPFARHYLECVCRGELLGLTAAGRINTGSEQPARLVVPPTREFQRRVGTCAQRELILAVVMAKFEAPQAMYRPP